MRQSLKFWFFGRANPDSKNNEPDFVGRALPLAALSMAALTSDAESAEPARYSKAIITAPKDCFVTQVLMASGATVSIGQPLLTLDSEDEDRILRQISLATSFAEM
jgi:acetyl/propionyl-CoA carboxylase alpha subunit